MEMLNIQLKKSLIGSKKNQLETAKSLQLRKIGDVTVQPNNAATQGKIRVLAHLIEVTEGGAA